MDVSEIERPMEERNERILERVTERVMERSRLRGRRFAAWIFVAFCVLASSRWLIEGALPGTGSTDVTQAVGFLMAAGVAALPVLFQRGRGGAPFLHKGQWRMALAGAMALCGTRLAASISDRYVSGDNATLALCLTPIVIAVALSARGSAASDDLTARLWPGLVGVAALLLLLPEPDLGRWRFTAALCLMPLLTGLGAAFIPPAATNGQDAWESTVGGRNVPWIVVALVIGGCMFGLLAIGREHGPFSIVAAALDGLISLLSLIVLGRLGPTRWAAQFLLIPLLTVLEGAVILRPVLDLRSWLAFVLLAAGAGYLFFMGAKREQPDAISITSTWV